MVDDFLRWLVVYTHAYVCLVFEDLLICMSCMYQTICLYVRCNLCLQSTAVLLYFLKTLALTLTLTLNSHSQARAYALTLVTTVLMYTNSGIVQQGLQHDTVVVVAGRPQY
jgi:hypothetical protein